MQNTKHEKTRVTEAKYANAKSKKTGLKNIDSKYWPIKKGPGDSPRWRP